MDDFDIEVTNLREQAVSDQAMQGQRMGRGGGRSAPISPFARRLTLRGHILAACTVALTVGVALLALVTQIPDLGAPLRQTLHLPAPPRSPSATDVIIVRGVVPWGTFTVDGAQPRLANSLPSGDPLLFGFMATQGGHTIRTRADPFLSYTCQFTLPPASDDTCQMTPTTMPAALVAHEPAGTRAYDLNLHETLDQLPAGQLARLRASIAATLPTDATQVRPGDHYLTPTGVSIATAPMDVTVQMTLLDDQTKSGACFTLCEDGGLSDPGAWALLALVTPSWRYTTPTGALTAAAILPTSGVKNSPIPVIVTWNGSWQVNTRGSDSASHLIFANASDTAQVYRAQFDTRYPQGWTAATFVASNPANGAEIVIGPTSPGGIPTNATVDLLYRFGVLLAINDEAHRLLPDLPVATDAEIAHWRGQ